jgi:hypothetical protein
MTSRIEFTPDRPLPDLPGLRDIDLETDVPTRPDTLPDGRRVLVIGELTRWQNVPLVPGDSARSCGLGVLLRLGESPLPGQTHALSIRGLAFWLESKGVPASIEQGHSLEDLALSIEAGWGVIAFVNSGELWGRADALNNGDPDRAVLVTAIVRDAQHRDLVGVYIREAAGESSGRLFLADALEAAWLGAGGSFLVVGARRE